MRTFVVGVIAIVVLGGCAGYMEKVRWYEKPWVEQLPAKDEEKAALTKARETGAKFKMAKDSSANDAWARAQVFVSKYSTMKLAESTDFVIETYAPNGWAKYGYAISRTPIGEEFEFEVKCVAGTELNDATKKTYVNLKTGELYQRKLTNDSTLTPAQRQKLADDCANNSAIAGHFIKTGEMVCERCVATKLAPREP